MANHYDVPSWAGKPPVGLHLDVMKGDKLIQKLMIDEKKCYLFGRNPQMNDFCIDHASCSRVHSALVYHKHLNRAFLVDLGSTHGTYIGSIRIESNKPTQLPIDSTFHFGASTRMYIIRERPQSGPKSQTTDEKEKLGEEMEGGLLGLPETETELDNLTEFNTAHNRRVSMLGIPDEEIRPINRKRKKKIPVSFSEDEEIINPEDIDPSVGKFRNMVQTTVIPTKKRKGESGQAEVVSEPGSKHFTNTTYSLYDDLPVGSEHSLTSPMSLLYPSSLSGKLGLTLPNPAPEVDMTTTTTAVRLNPAPATVAMESLPPEPRKKKYAKEAWPGKKPLPSLLV